MWDPNNSITFQAEKRFYQTGSQVTIRGKLNHGNWNDNQENKYLMIAPYSQEDYKIITQCAFSPLQASCIYRMIQEKKLITELELSDSSEEMIAFKKLSPTIQKLFEAQQE